MDHTLGDSLNLESTMEGMDFESSGVVDNRTDIALDTGSHVGDMAMEFEHNIEEQQILMDSGNEEIIVSDFMGDQFNLQEYSIQDDQTSTMTTVEDSNQQCSQAEATIDLQFENAIRVKQETNTQPPFLAVRAAPSVHPSTSKKSDAMLSNTPRQIAIAPKLPKLVPVVGNRVMTAKPLTVLANKPNFLKKVPLSSIVQSGGKGNTVLAQIGKQLVMMPQGGSQKIKLVSTNSAGVSTVQYIKAADQAQLIPNKNTGNKPVVAKVIQVQGQPNADSSNQPAVITKILPTSSAQNMQQTRYIMQTKTVPISIGNQVIMASPTKHGVKYTKKHEIISLKQPILPKLAPASIGPTTKKVLISANPSQNLQNVILKTTAPPKTAQVTKDGKVIVQQGPRSQYHQINVPGKGIQYIRLITNQTPAAKTKKFVLSDTNNGPKKLMRIAPASAQRKLRTPPLFQQQPIRPAQSLLAPLSPTASEESADFTAMQEHSSIDPLAAEAINEEIVDQEESQDTGAESAHSDGGGESPDDAQPPEPAHPPQNVQSFESNDNTESTQVEGQQQPEHPLIVISGNYLPQDNQGDREPQQEESSRMMNEDQDPLNPYQSPKTPPPDSDVMSGELAFKPRRACNCTKSQCLKLYCDCFANGEFCHGCNCNNCHNNLAHEDLRQRAIRACLERNPNAFRPKIGKTKAGGPEIIRRHNKGCNCKRSGCLKNYCECYEAKIACTAMCKCVGCRNVEEALARRRPAALYRPPHAQPNKQPCTFMTTEVIEAVCQCLLAAAAAGKGNDTIDVEANLDVDPVRDIVDEFGRCLQDIIGASHHQLLDQGRA